MYFVDATYEYFTVKTTAFIRFLAACINDVALSNWKITRNLHLIPRRREGISNWFYSLQRQSIRHLCSGHRLWPSMWFEFGGNRGRCVLNRPINPLWCCSPGIDRQFCESICPICCQLRRFSLPHWSRPWWSSMVRDPCMNPNDTVKKDNYGFKWEGAVPGKICHFHHDHAHVFREEDNVVASVIPFGHFRIECHLLLSEQFNLLSNFLFVLFGHFAHGLAGCGDAADVWILVDSTLAGVGARCKLQIHFVCHYFVRKCTEIWMAREQASTTQQNDRNKTKQITSATSFQCLVFDGLEFGVGVQIFGALFVW